MGQGDDSSNCYRVDKDGIVVDKIKHLKLSRRFTVTIPLPISAMYGRTILFSDTSSTTMKKRKHVSWLPLYTVLFQEAKLTKIPPMKYLPFMSNFNCLVLQTIESILQVVKKTDCRPASYGFEFSVTIVQ